MTTEKAWSISSDQRFRIQKDWTRKGALWRAEYRAVKRDVRKQVDPRVQQGTPEKQSLFISSDERVSPTS
ncbi:unnamed protein product [Urochloa humidicola]